MAKKKWMVLPGGRLKRWRKSMSELGCRFTRQVPPRWYRNSLNRKERRRAARAIRRGEAHRNAYVHPREAAWYW